MKDGEVVETGTHEYLSKHGKEYIRLSQTLNKNAKKDENIPPMHRKKEEFSNKRRHFLEGDDESIQREEELSESLNNLEDPNI